MQNTPLVVPDPSGVGDDVVVAGTYGGIDGDNTQGFIAVYQVTDGDRTTPSGTARGRSSTTTPSSPVRPSRPPRRRATCIPDVPPCSTEGYWMTATDGGLFAYGDAPFYGSMGGQRSTDRWWASPPPPIAAATGRWPPTAGCSPSATPTSTARWAGTPLDEPVVGIAPTPDGHGYWEVASDGGIFAFGDAHFYGSMGGTPSTSPSWASPPPPTATATGRWPPTAASSPSATPTSTDRWAGQHLNKPIVGIASTPDGHGYWEVASDGGIFAFGDAAFYGSMGGSTLNRPIVGMATTADGHGYWMVASDGGVFSFGDAYFRGSAGNVVLNAPVVGVTGNG